MTCVTQRLVSLNYKGMKFGSYLVQNLITERRNRRAEEKACCKMRTVRSAKMAMAACCWLVNGRADQSDRNGMQYSLDRS